MKHQRLESTSLGLAPTILLPLTLLLVSCDSTSERAVLDTEHVGQVGQPAEGQKPLDRDSPLTPPDTYLRTDFELDTEGDIDADVRIEEVTAGLRVEVILEDAQPGAYEIAIHTSGTCSQPPLGPDKSLKAAPNDSGDAGEESTFGKFEVDADGQGRARWLTSRGNLRKNDNHSVLDHPLALYRIDEAGRREAMACGTVVMD